MRLNEQERKWELTYEPDHLRWTIASIKATNLWSCLSKNSIVCCYLHAIRGVFDTSTDRQTDACPFIAETCQRHFIRSISTLHACCDRCRRHYRVLAACCHLSQMYNLVTAWAVSFCMHSSWKFSVSNQLRCISETNMCQARSGLRSQGQECTAIEDVLTVRSQIMCRICPPPTAKPATMAITGFGKRRICTCTYCRWETMRIFFVAQKQLIEDCMYLAFEP